VRKREKGRWNKSSKITMGRSLPAYSSLSYPILPVLDADFSIRMVKYLEAVRGWLWTRVRFN